MKTAQFFLVTLFLVSCSATKNIQKTGIDEVSFGNGGGFTGKTTTYTLKSDGKLLKNDEFFKQINRKQTEKIFEQAKKNYEIKYYNVGNIYNFITIKTKEKSNRIVWTLGDKNLNINILEFYINLNNLILK